MHSRRRALALVVCLAAASAAALPDTTLANEAESATILWEVPRQTFSEAEKEIADFVNSLLRSLLPKIVGGSGDAHLSPKCTAGMMKLFGNLRRLKGWTLKLLDSMGKPVPGILKGTSYSMGSYDECLDVSVTNKGVEATDPKDEMFRGKYCRVRITLAGVVIETSRNYHKGMVNASDLGKLKEIIQEIPYTPVSSNYMNHFIGMCFPSSCSLADIEQLVPLLPFPGTATIDRCEMKSETEVDITQLVIICLFLFLAVIAAGSTFVDWLFHSKRREKSNNDSRDKRCVSVTVAFSFCNNTKSLLRNIEEESEGLLSGQSVRGIYVASVAWIILGNTYLYPYEGYYLHMSSLKNLQEFWNQGYFSAIISSLLAIDALFVCYGFLFTYSLWYQALKPEDVTINVITLIVKNYLRFSIPLLLCYGFIFLLPLFGSGPLWEDLLGNSIKRCRANVGAHFGMYSNFLEFEDQCFPHLWFVSCLAQLTLAGIFLSWILARNVKIGVFTTLLICIGCSAAVGVISYNNDFPPSYVAYFTEEYSSFFWKINMALPLNHFASYAAGMLAGIFIARRDNRPSRMCPGAIGWIVCLGLSCALHLLLYNSRDGSLGRVWSAVFASVHRPAFATCVSWVVVACSFGMGGFVNNILSWRIFDPIFRLSYYAYIFHFVIISYVVSVARSHFAYTHLELILRASSYVAATYFVVYFFYMILEMPLKSLRLALSPQKSFRIEVTPLNHVTPAKGDVISQNTIEGSCKLWSISETHNGTSY